MQTNQESYFISFRGIVIDISILSDNNTYWNYLLVETNEGVEANLVVSPATYFAYNTIISVGMEVTGYFPANAPVPLIYPPQYLTTVIVTEPALDNIKVDYFDYNLVSLDGMLKLNIEDNTRIVMQDGSSYRGILGNQLLVVYYGASTRSIPAITTPTKIVILNAAPQ